MENNMNSLVTTSDSKIDVNEALDDWNTYQKLCNMLLDESDYQVYTHKNKRTGEIIETRSKKKSAWQKLARAFNVVIEPVSKEIIRNKLNVVMEVEYTVRATLPNGRSVIAEGTCDRHEKGKAECTSHTIKSTAETRATNRAISLVLGAGEVSEEELDPNFQLESYDENVFDVESEIIENTSVEMVEPENKSYGEPDFVTANEIDGLSKDFDPIIFNYAKSIKTKVEEKGKEVTKITMKSQMYRMVKNNEIPEEFKERLLSFIDSNCPEGLY